MSKNNFVLFFATFLWLTFSVMAAQPASAQEKLVLTNKANGKVKEIKRGDYVKMYYQRSEPGKKLVVNMGIRINKNRQTGYFQGRVLKIEPNTLSVINVVDTLTLPLVQVNSIRRKPKVGRHIVRILHAGGLITPFFFTGLNDVPALLIGGTVQELTWAPMDDNVYYPMWKLEHAGGNWKIKEE